MNGKMPVYYKCNMSKMEHIAVYIGASLLLSVVAYLFYHWIPVSVVIGFLAGIYLEKCMQTVRSRKDRSHSDCSLRISSGR